MSSYLKNLRRWADTAAAYVIGAVLVGGTLWGWFGPEPKRTAPEVGQLKPEMELFHSVQKTSPAAAVEFMLSSTTGHTLKEPNACILERAFASSTETSGRQEAIRLDLLRQHEDACRIGRELREATLPQLKAIAVTGELLSRSFYFGLFDTVMQKNEWEKIGPFADETVCEHFASQVLGAGFGVRSCERWVPAF